MKAKDVDVKVCTGCGLTKRVEDFTFSTSVGRRLAQCKRCKADYVKSRRKSVAELYPPKEVTAKPRPKGRIDNSLLLLSPADEDLRSLKYNYLGLGYAMCTRARGDQLHRMVMERVVGRKLLTEETVDHINGERLDNRRENLRIATKRENCTNTHGPMLRKRTPGPRGVYPTPGGRWYASTVLRDETDYRKKKAHHLGTFDTMEEAAEAFMAFKRSRPGYVERENV